eukprot:CAMPEP_0175289178 /NCGR_PEP_ID=MMETSP0093-20121207/55194_1 /TAXON_ID=311494 /ORGANISM="Alexandrium monilatum, Strain CCMP3105" /LENGTH=50 /DNA_ID=CAMNT_0016584765 /DNA_START=30 /DNA_END=179 /DNA_ORIENTATION=-
MAHAAHCMGAAVWWKIRGDGAEPRGGCAMAAPVRSHMPLDTPPTRLTPDR